MLSAYALRSLRRSCPALRRSSSYGRRLSNFPLRSRTTVSWYHNRNKHNSPSAQLCRIRDSQQINHLCRRSFSIESIPSILVPPAVFAGLLLTLWTWKCMMMVIFQDKIIYMPSMPPFARSEKMNDYTAMCKPVEWEERRIQSLDGTRIALCIGKLPPASGENKHALKEVVVCYFQGNGSSLPPRLPVLSNVLRSVQARAAADDIPIQYTLVGLSYRGYWTSGGRASQSGIELDAQALLSYVSANFAGLDIPTEIILWGQSIGSGIATTAATKYISQHHNKPPKITALVLETPFTSVKSMLIALYPQKWLPYRYLWPLLWNRWDSEAALRRIALSSATMPKVLILPATRDEVVPAEEADKLVKICSDLDVPFQRKNVEGALHNEATVRRDGQEAIAKFIADIVGSR